MAAIWAANPGLSPQQVQARFGQGARLVRMGDGRWTIAGGSMGAATSNVPKIAPPVGPAAARNVVGTPPAPSTTTPPVVPPKDPVSVGQESNITNLIAQRAGLSGIYNPQRNASAIEGARGLTDNGYYDIANPVAVYTDPVTGATSYSVAGQGEGRVQRENAGNINAANNSRGTLFSSATSTQQRQNVTALKNAREAALRGLEGEQKSSIAQQTSDFSNLGAQIGNAQGDYADWRASQAVPLPAPVSESFATPTAPKPPAGAGLPKIINNPGAKSIPALRRMGYVQSGTRWVRR